MSGQPPETFRMWSIVYREDMQAPPSHEKAVSSHQGPHTHLCNKADLSHVINTLLAPPEGPYGVVVADSGQIHCLPQARLNWQSRQWTVRFERSDVTSTPERFGHVLHHCAALYAGGFIKDDILSGQPAPSKLVKHGLEFWRHHNTELLRHRGGALLELSVFLLREGNRDELRDRTARFGSPLCPGVAAVSIDRQDTADRLVASSSDSARDGSGDAVVLDDGHEDGQKAAGRDAHHVLKQGNLFDW